MSDAAARGDNPAIENWIKEYDKAWDDYDNLPNENSSVSTLYTKDYSRHIRKSADSKVNELRER